MGSVLKDAGLLRDHLRELARFLRSGPLIDAELRAPDADCCDDAAAMLQKLGTEVTRLRLSIGRYRYHMMSRADLVALPDT